MGDFPMLSKDELLRQLKGLAYGVGMAVTVAVLAELQRQLGGNLAPEWASFKNVSLAGLALTAVRSAGSAGLVWFTQKNTGGK